jgi:hypothetical protein
LRRRKAALRRCVLRGQITLFGHWRIIARKRLEFETA